MGRRARCGVAQCGASRPGRRVTAAIIAACVLWGLGGCFSMQSAARGRSQAALSADDAARAQHADCGVSLAWPSRDERAVEPYRTTAPADLFEFEPHQGVTIESMDETSRAQVQEAALRIQTSEVRSGGVFRTWTKKGQDATLGALADLLGGFEPNAAYLSSYRVNDERWMAGRELARERLQAMNLARSVQKLPTWLTGQEEASAINEGVRLQMPGPSPENVKGILVHLTSLIPNRYEMAVVDRIERDGWAVISIDTDAAIRAPHDPAKLARLPEIRDGVARTQMELAEIFKKNDLSAEGRKNQDQVQARLAALMREQRTIERGEYTLCAAEDATGVAAAIARATDEVLAENAYAAEAALAHLDEHRPELRGRPVLMMGFSAGALTLPAVAARLGDRVIGAVIVAGGADLLDVSLTTNLEWAAIPIRCEGKRPADPALDALRAAYLERVRLDPVKTAPALARLPVLQVHATRDKTVSSASGERLHELLGKPDRINFWGDHRLLFYFLPDEADRIARWVERNVRPERMPAATPGQPGASEPATPPATLAPAR